MSCPAGRSRDHVNCGMLGERSSLLSAQRDKLASESARDRSSRPEGSSCDHERPGTEGERSSRLSIHRDREVSEPACLVRFLILVKISAGWISNVNAPNR